jgi:hypothetical protein
MSGYATITGRVVGPDGLGREGRVEFFPLTPYEGVEEDGSRLVVAHYAAGRLTANGHLVDASEERSFRLIAPSSLPDGENNYRVVVVVPGTPGGRREYLAGVIANTTVDLTDIIAGRRVEDDASARVRPAGEGILEPINPDDIAEIGGGLLAWKEDING